MAASRSFLGVYLNSYEVQSESMKAVFDNLESVGCRAVVITPWVSVLASEGEGTRIPERHMDGYRRLLARSAYGRRELYVKSYRVFPPKARVYEATRYMPRFVKSPVDVDVELPRWIAEEARIRGMGVYTQVSPFVVPGLLPEDQPKYPDGTVPGRHK